MKKCLKFLRNPFWSFTFIVVLLFLMLFFINHFQFPDYYSNRIVAQEFINSCNQSDCAQLDRLYKNPFYNLHNSIFHIFSLSIALLFITFVFKIKQWTDFIQKTIFSKRWFTYFFLNVAYLIWAYNMEKILEATVNQYVYHPQQDSVMIAYMGIYFMLLVFAILYYPIVNIFNFVVLNTKIVNKLLIFLYKIVVVLLGFNIVITIPTLFMWNYIIVDFIKIVYLLIAIGSINILRQKFDKKMGL